MNNIFGNGWKSTLSVGPDPEHLFAGGGGLSSHHCLQVVYLSFSKKLTHAKMFFLNLRMNRIRQFI